MDFILTPHKAPALTKTGGLKSGINNNTGGESLLYTRSKQMRFLELLASQRANNGAVKFHGIDLSNVDLSNVDLSGIDLTGANFTNANLNGAKLIGTNLTGAKLVRTILVNADLTNAILANVVIDRITQLALRQASGQQWYEAAQLSISGFAQKWEKLKSIDGFNSFEAVLKRLNSCALKNSVTTAEIVDVIEAIIKSPDICHLVFQSARGVNVDSSTHLLSIFNTAQGLMKFVKLLNANAGQQEILDLAKGMVRKSLLDEATLPVMRNQWSEGRRACNGAGTGPDVKDALKVQWALNHQLAAQLKLPFSIKYPLNTADIVELNNSDNEFAVDYVNKCMNDKEQLIEALIALPIWQLYLKRVSGEKLAQINFSSDAADTLLRQETEKMLAAEHN